MKLVTDSGVDIIFPPEMRNSIDLEIVLLRESLDGISYREGIDIERTEFYDLLAATTSLPVTSEPSAADFAETYQRLAKTNPEILSIHTSSGLSQTFNSAARLKGKIMKVYNLEWLPIRQMSLVLSAHTGPSMIGVTFTDQ